MFFLLARRSDDLPLLEQNCELARETINKVAIPQINENP